MLLLLRSLSSLLDKRGTITKLGIIIIIVASTVIMVDMHANSEVTITEIYKQ